MAEETKHLRATRWTPGAAPQPITLEEAAELIARWQPGEPLVAVDVDPREFSPAELTEQLRPLVPVLTETMVKDLIETDPLPQAATLENGVRCVSMFGVRAYDDGGLDGTSAGSMFFDFIEILTGEGWLLSCCQPPAAFPRGATDPRDAKREVGTRCDDFVAGVTRRWVAKPYRTAGDLGVLILHELTCTYRHARASLYRWLDTWEEDFFRHGRTERDTLTELRTMLSEFRKRLYAENVPDDEAQYSWFPDATDAAMAQRADNQIDRAIADLLALSETLRATFDLVQMQLSQRQQETSERLGRKVELITSVLIVPTLVAGFYGANTRLPGEPGEGPWTGFEVMIASMILGSIAVYVGLRALRQRYERAAA